MKKKILQYLLNIKAKNGNPLAQLCPGLVYKTFSKKELMHAVSGLIDDDRLENLIITRNFTDKY